MSSTEEEIARAYFNILNCFTINYSTLGFAETWSCCHCGVSHILDDPEGFRWLGTHYFVTEVMRNHAKNCSVLQLKLNELYPKIKYQSYNYVVMKKVCNESNVELARQVLQLTRQIEKLTFRVVGKNCDLTDDSKDSL